MTMLDTQVEDRLLTSLSQFLAAQSAGTTRFVIADAYLSVDNLFSAILILRNKKPSTNHKVKLQEAWKELETELKEEGVTLDEVEKFRDMWNSIRYSSQITPSTSDAIRLRNIARLVRHIVISEVAAKVGQSEEEVEDGLYVKLLGARFTIVDDAVSEVHEAWQQHLETMGEMGQGSKLGNKLANPSNYAEISVFSDDEVTRKILAENEELAREFMEVYHAFLKTILKMQGLRISQMGLNEAPAFNLSVRLRYESTTLEEEANRWGEMLAQGLKQAILNLSQRTNSTSTPESEAG